jgi:kinesin family protein 2/24
MNGEIDCISSINPSIYVHECKIKIDGITKYIEDHGFVFDNCFSEKESTEDVYRYSVNPTINMILNRGIVTCFAYGQTGSGKTYTMVNYYYIERNTKFID